MKVTIQAPGRKPQCIIFPTGLLANNLTAGIVWSALNLAIHTKLPYRFPKELVRQLQKTKLPPGMALVEYENPQGTFVKVEL